MSRVRGLTEAVQALTAAREMLGAEQVALVEVLVDAAGPQMWSDGEKVPMEEQS